MSENLTENVAVNENPEPTVDELKAQLEQLQKQADELRDNWQRARADYANLKRRTDAEAGDLRLRANEAILKRLLPSVDDFERARLHLPQEFVGNAWIEGVMAIERKLKTVLEQSGVVEIPSENQEFDPKVHEAVAHDDNGAGKDWVAEVYQRGYKLGDSVLRPAMVRVGRKDVQQ